MLKKKQNKYLINDLLKAIKCSVNKFILQSIDADFAKKSGSEISLKCKFVKKISSQIDSYKQK